EPQTVVETTAGTETVRLIHEYSCHTQLRGNSIGVCRSIGVDSAGMPSTFEVEKPLDPVQCRVQLTEAIHRQDDGQLFPAEGVVSSDTVLLDKEEPCRARRLRVQSGQSRDLFRRLRGHSGTQDAIRPH